MYIQTIISNVNNFKKLYRRFVTINNKKYLDYAQEYAENNSTCLKVKVGCVITTVITKKICALTIMKKELVVGVGTNVAMPNDCKFLGCLRIQKYGENSKQHRNPDDCRAIHSEASAIGNALKDNSIYGKKYKLCTAYITRYPCENCARILIASGIKKVVYGREQEISLMTKKMFSDYGVEVVWEKSWTYEDTIN